MMDQQASVGTLMQQLCRKMLPGSSESVESETTRTVKTVNSPVWSNSPVGDPTKLIQRIQRKVPYQSRERTMELYKQLRSSCKNDDAQVYSLLCFLAFVADEKKSTGSVSSPSGPAVSKRGVSTAAIRGTQHSESMDLASIPSPATMALTRSEPQSRRADSPSTSTSTATYRAKLASMALHTQQRGMDTAANSASTTSGVGIGAVVTSSSLAQPSPSRIENSAVKETPMRSMSARRTAGTAISGRNAYDPEYTYSVTEEDILADVLSCVQGMEGKYIRLTPKKDCYVIDKAARMDSAVRHRCQYFLDCGKIYRSLNEFVVRPLVPHISRGCIAQAFAGALKTELLSYSGTVIQISALIRDSENTANSSNRPNLSKIRLLLWESNNRLELLQSLVQHVGNKKGGRIITKLFHCRQSQAVASDAYDCAGRSLDAVCVPFYTMLVRWMCSGTLVDPHSEFIVQENEEITVTTGFNWASRYSIRESAMPAFMTQKQAEKVLLAGKSTNFLEEVCRERSHEFSAKLSSNKIKAENFDVSSLYTIDRRWAFDKLLDQLNADVGSALLEVLTDSCHMKTHLHAMNKYILLTQGDFVTALMNLLGEELGRRASDMGAQHCVGVLTAAIRSTNAQHEPDAVLDRIDVDAITETDSNATGWDRFTLKYRLQGPICTVVNDNALVNYGRLYHLVWRLKRLHFLLRNCWLELRASRELVAAVPEAYDVLHNFQLLIVEMQNFMIQLEFYVTHEVMSNTWRRLCLELEQAHDLDAVISAHDKYLGVLLKGCFLDLDSVELQGLLGVVLTQILSADRQVRGAIDMLTEEAQATAHDHRSATDSGWGWTQQKDMEAQERRMAVVTSLLRKVKPALGLLKEQYQTAVKSLLLKLVCQPQESVKSLSFRLDFSGFYYAHEPRLQQELTYSRQSQYCSVGAPTASSRTSTFPRFRR